MRNGIAFQREPSELTTAEIDFSLWPTLTTEDTLRQRRFAQGGTPLGFRIWQTLTVTDAKGRPYTYSNGDHSKPFLTLLGQVLAANADPLPTFTKRDQRTMKGGRDRPNRRGGASLLQTFLTRGHSSGYLSPRWCEWFMGFPETWTQLAPSVTPSSRKSRNGSGGD